VRLVLVSDPRGVPLGFTLVPANEREYEQLADLLTGTPSEVVIADKGLWGRGYRERLAAAGTELLTPAKERTSANESRERRLASRVCVGSVVLAPCVGFDIRRRAPAGGRARVRTFARTC
jgi:IS5 family transposase